MNHFVYYTLASPSNILYREHAGMLHFSCCDSCGRRVTGSQLDRHTTSERSSVCGIVAANHTYASLPADCTCASLVCSDLGVKRAGYALVVISQSSLWMTYKSVALALLLLFLPGTLVVTAIAVHWFPVPVESIMHSYGPAPSPLTWCRVIMTAPPGVI